jgi:hypothetical protein
MTEARSQLAAKRDRPSEETNSSGKLKDAERHNKHAKRTSRDKVFFLPQRLQAVLHLFTAAVRSSSLVPHGVVVGSDVAAPRS